MPKIGEYRKNARLQDEWWTICSKCNEGFWSRGFKECVKCYNVVGAKYKTTSGLVYIKLAEDDPFYEFTVRTLGTLGAGWINEGRYVMMTHLGRPLDQKELVYHKNSKADDNRLENLTLTMTAKQKKGMIRAKWARKKARW